MTTSQHTAKAEQLAEQATALSYLVDMEPLEYVEHLHLLAVRKFDKALERLTCEAKRIMGGGVAT
jgi:hypothetical protein